MHKVLNCFSLSFFLLLVAQHLLGTKASSQDISPCEKSPPEVRAEVAAPKAFYSLTIQQRTSVKQVHQQLEMKS
jgi:hypothetical protein